MAAPEEEEAPSREEENGEGSDQATAGQGVPPHIPPTALDLSPKLCTPIGVPPVFLSLTGKIFIEWN